MSRPAASVGGPCRRLAVIGGGWCGAALTRHLLATRRTDLAITLFERRAHVGRGVAFGTEDDAHLLNVPASEMSLDPADPDDFRRFAVAHGHDGSANALLPRRLYGAYVAERLLHAVASSPVRVRLEQAEVVDLSPPPGAGGAWSLRTADGRVTQADEVVLATGHGPPRLPPALAAALPDPRVLVDAYAPGALAGIGADERVLVVGTGLTAVDVLLTLRRREHRGRVVAVSRGGRWPCPHLPGVVASGPRWRLDADEAPRGADALVAWVRGHVDDAAGRGVPWQVVIGALRPHVADLWRRLPDGERRRFLAEHRGAWEVARHRVPAPAFEALHRWRREGWLTTLRGEVREVVPGPVGLTVVVGAPGDEEVLFVDRVVVCTGAESDPSRFRHPLWDGLLRRGLVALDPLGLGVPTDADGRVLGVDGPTPGLWTLGGLRRTERFESTAVPDLALQAVALAARLAGVPRQNEASTSTFTRCSASPN